MGAIRTQHTFHNAATVAADGTTMNILSGQHPLAVEISGTSTSRTIDFKGKVAGGVDYRSIMGVNLATLATAIQTTGNNELWQFDVSCLASVMMDLSAVAGGNVTVKGACDE